jgi:PAS domain S-box-containing protein
MSSDLHVLVIEDVEDDMLLMLRELRRGGYTLDYVRVETPEEMQAALDRQLWDIVIADYSLPAFSAPEALKLLQLHQQDIPFIIVSGTIGEETAVAAMKAGAHDYIIKGNLARLVPAVERELREAKERQKRQNAERALRESEEALRQSQHQYQTLAEASPVGIFRTDAQGNCVYVNRQWCEMTGISFEQSLGAGWLEALHPDDRDRVLTTWQRAVQDNLPFDLEYRFQRPDRKNIWVVGQALAEQRNGEAVTGYVGTVTDISDRKQAEESLHILSTALSSAVEGISQIDAQGRYISVNAAYAALVGYQPEEMIGIAWQQTVHPEDQPKMVAAYQHMLSHGKVEMEARGIRKDGSSFYMQLVMVTAYDKQQQLIGHYCFAKDITERKQTEQKVREQAALLDITTDAICVRDLEHRILFWNEGAERLYGWETTEALGKNAMKLLYRPGEKLSQFSAIQTTLIQEGQWQGEFQEITKDSKTIVVESRWTLMRDDDDNPKSILTVSTDITEKKQLEAQFLRAQRLESLGTLASGIAHDFNNILTPILAISQLLPLKLPDLDEHHQQMLRILEDNTKRGADLVKQILVFARGGEGDRVPLQINHLLSEIVQMARQTFPKDIEIHANLSTIDLWTVSADATQLHQVLMNLAVNARDAMPNGGTLSLSAENILVDEAFARVNLEAHPGSYVVITVSDTGTGIPAELLERIFDPFFTTKEVGKGTGLGLSTTLGIVKDHEGFVKVYSEVGQGSQFKVYLPTLRDKVTQPTEEPVLLSGHNELILIVEDEPSIQQVTRASLEDCNYRTLTANDGIEAIALYAEHKHEISLVLMDIMMPSMDGLSAIRALQKLNPKVNVIAMSGLATNSQVAEAMGSSVKAFLPKPYTVKELLDTIHRVLA